LIEGLKGLIGVACGKGRTGYPQRRAQGLWVKEIPVEASLRAMTDDQPNTVSG